MRVLISILIFTGLIQTGFSQSVVDSVESVIQLRTYVESENIPLNREVVYHIELSWQGDLSRYRISEIIEPSVSNLTTRGSGSSNKVRTSADGQLTSVKEITFYFRPLEMGMAYIDGVIIRYHDTSKEKAESLISSRIGVKIIDPLPEPSANGNLSGIIGAVFLLFILIAAVLFYLRYKRNQQEALEKARTERIETIEEKYLRILKETIHFNTDNIKDSLGDLTHLLNGYFSERYHMPAQSMADHDLIRALNEKKISNDILEKTEDFYKKASLVKFAAESVSEADYHRLYDSVELILTNQKSSIAEEDA